MLVHVRKITDFSMPTVTINLTGMPAHGDRLVFGDDVYNVRHTIWQHNKLPIVEVEEIG